jgi:hypothetical protein
MTKNTTFLKLIQTILTDDDIKEIAQDLGIDDASNKVTLRTVTEYMMMSAAHGWTGYRDAADVGPAAGLIQLDEAGQQPASH